MKWLCLVAVRTESERESERVVTLHGNEYSLDSIRVTSLLESLYKYILYFPLYAVCEFLFKSSVKCF